MKHSVFVRSLALTAVAAAIAGCTMKEQEPPALSGPSEFAQSLTVTVSPDVLTQDGASQSVVTVTARGPNGTPLASVPLRAEILVGGIPTDFGSISARNLVTDSSGRAMLVYTAPSSPAGPAVDEFTLVNISITPVGNDFGNSSPRVTTLRLVPPGVVAPPDGLRPAFTFLPTAPTDNQNVLFDASSSAAPANNAIVKYQWTFGDGGSGSGVTATYSYDTPGTYTVTLTVIDGFGRSRSTSQSITVAAGIGPTAVFVASPTVQSINQDLFFNASQSTPAPGRRIERYRWEFGDGSGSNAGPTTSHAYTRAGTFVVTLTVTDDAGRKATATGQVTVTP